MTNTLYSDSPGEQEENKNCFKRQPSAKLSEHRRTQILLVKLHTRHSQAIYLSNAGFKGPWRLFA